MDFLGVAREWVGWVKGNISFGGAFCFAKYEIRKRKMKDFKNPFKILAEAEPRSASWRMRGKAIIAQNPNFENWRRGGFLLTRRSAMPCGINFTPPSKPGSIKM